MTSITISFPDEFMGRLREFARKYGVSPEDLARVGVEELVSLPDEEFQRSAAYVLGKNSDLYKRLA